MPFLQPILTGLLKFSLKNHFTKGMPESKTTVIIPPWNIYTEQITGVAESKNVISDSPVSSGHVIWHTHCQFCYYKRCTAVHSCYSSDFNEIWQSDVDFDSGDGPVTKNQSFTNPRWRTDAILISSAQLNPLSD